MNKYKEDLFEIIIKFITFTSILLLLSILLFIFRESLKFFSRYSIITFIFGKDWRPLANPPSFSIGPMILATIFISILAVVIALPFGVGSAVFVATIPSNKFRSFALWLVNLLAGVPSVIFGLIGLSVIVKTMESRFSFISGECLFVGSLILAIMILPYIISICEETVYKTYIKYNTASKALGISKWYMIYNLVLKSSKKSILVSVVLALGRAMGETMAVMMVIGNAPILPRLFGKVETIPSLIALEMGSAQVDSDHYHALYASGFILMLLLIIINTIFYYLKKRLLKEEK